MLLIFKLAIVALTFGVSSCNSYNESIFMLSWSDVNLDSVRFEFTTKTDLTDKVWSAFAFSYDDKMGNDNVNLCKVVNGEMTVENYYNEGKRPRPLDPNQLSVGMTDIHVSLADGELKCSFTRLKSDPSVVNFFDINYDYIILTALGYFDVNNTLRRHTYRSNSSVKYSFTNNSITTVETTTLTSQTKPETTTQIPTTSTIVQTTTTPNNQPGTFQLDGFTLQWVDSDDKTDFTYYADLNSFARAPVNNYWIGFAFSYDQKMGDDGVTMCKIYNNVGAVESMYNPDTNGPVYLLDTNKTIGITNAVVTAEDNKLKCSFARQKFVPNVKHYFDAHNKWYLLVARGPVSSSGDYEGHTDAAFSDNLIDFQTASNNSGSTKDQTLAKTHGCVMVVAWIFFGSIGILFARHFKFIFPSTMWLNVKFWFNVHRSFMVLAPVLSVTAFIIIFYDLDWEWVTQANSITFMHSLFGIVTVGLCVIQVILGMIRPDGNHPKRYLFNYGHRLLGFTTFIASIVAIILGVFIPRMGLGWTTPGLLIAWALWIFFLFITFDLIELKSANLKNLKVNTDDEDTSKIELKYQNIKSILLLVHIVFTVAVVLATVIIIATADNKKS